MFQSRILRVAGLNEYSMNAIILQRYGGGNKDLRMGNNNNNNDNWQRRYNRVVRRKLHKTNTRRIRYGKARVVFNRIASFTVSEF